MHEKYDKEDFINTAEEKKKFSSLLP